MGLPVVHYRPLAGQGLANAAFTERAGLARWARSVPELAATVRTPPTGGADMPLPGRDAVTEVLDLAGRRAAPVDGMTGTAGVARPRPRRSAWPQPRTWPSAGNSRRAEPAARADRPGSSGSGHLRRRTAPRRHPGGAGPTGPGRRDGHLLHDGGTAAAAPRPRSLGRRGGPRTRGARMEPPTTARPAAGRISGELTATCELITAVAGVAPRWYRPPYGVATGEALWAARRLGLRPAWWHRWGRDWRARATPAGIARAVIGPPQRPRLHGGNVILLHDSDTYGTPGSWRSTAAAPPAILGYAAEQGLRVSALDGGHRGRRPSMRLKVAAGVPTNRSENISTRRQSARSPDSRWTRHSRSPPA